MVVILSRLRSDDRTVASRDGREVHLGVVDAVEDVGEDGGRESQANLDELGVAVTGGLDSGELLVAEGAAAFRELADEAGQCIALGIAYRLAIADILQFVGLQSCELAEQA